LVKWSIFHSNHKWSSSLKRVATKLLGNNIVFVTEPTVLKHCWQNGHKCLLTRVFFSSLNEHAKYSFSLLATDRCWQTLSTTSWPFADLCITCTTNSPQKYVFIYVQLKRFHSLPIKRIKCRQIYCNQKNANKRLRPRHKPSRPKPRQWVILSFAETKVWDQT